MEILNGVFFNREDFATLTELARRDDETIGELRNEVEELKSALESVRRDRDAWHAEYKMASGDLKHNREDVVSLVQERDALRDELEQVKAKLELAITLGTLFMVAAAKE